jgi:hypothetical protein
MPNGQTIVIQLQAFRIARPRLTVVPSWDKAPAAEQPRFMTAAEAVTRARDEVDDGRIAQAISTLWSATENLLRREGEESVTSANLEIRLAVPFLKYFPARQLALLGVYLDSSRSTRPRFRAPVDPSQLWTDLESGELQRRIVGRRVFLRRRINELLVLFHDAEALQGHLVDVRRRIRDVLFAARIIRNALLHSRLRVAAEFEERYVYRWFETLLDVTLNAALGQSRRTGFTLDSYLASLPGTLTSFEEHLAKGPPHSWLFEGQ